MESINDNVSTSEATSNIDSSAKKGKKEKDKDKEELATTKKKLKVLKQALKDEKDACDGIKKKF